MPEGPELHLASRFVNECCKGTVFSGNIVKSEVHKSEEIKFKSDAYTISATSRGKELQLFLSSVQDDKKSTKKAAAIDPQSHAAILFRFGMSGKFEFTAEADLHKHAHLKFFTESEPRMVLSYVDVRRFGRFEETTQWGKDRGPDPMFEYKEFRLNVLESLSSSEFDRPICEVLLNQKYFNGIGNYLRAEILYRIGIPPFEQARRVFEGLPEIPPDVKPKMKGSVSKNKDQKADILHLCHSVPLEVVNLGGGGYDPEGNKTDYNAFTEWLQCYYQDGMKQMVDHNKRTIWFSGPTGPLIPKDGKLKSPTKRKTNKQKKENETKSHSIKKAKEGDEEKSTSKVESQENGETAKGVSSKSEQRKGSARKQQDTTRGKKKTSKKTKTDSSKVEHFVMKSEEQDKSAGQRRSARLRKV